MLQAVLLLLCLALWCRFGLLVGKEIFSLSTSPFWVPAVCFPSPLCREPQQ